MANRLLGDRIRLRRLELGMTQVEVSAVTGIEQGYLSRIERGGIGRPNRDLLVTLADALRLPADDLLVAADYTVETAVIRLTDDDVERVAVAVARRIAEKMVAA